MIFLQDETILVVLFYSLILHSTNRKFSVHLFPFVNIPSFRNCCLNCDFNRKKNKTSKIDLKDLNNCQKTED